MEIRSGIVDGKYGIVNKIGGGGFSEVYLVAGAQGECALKLLKEVSTSGGHVALEEFKNEFAVLKNLNHPHIARILDFGYDDELERYYYTSEMIRGANLFDATDDLPVGDVMDLIVQSLRALEYLHSFHIYHFDIKSANVLVIPGKPPAVKLIDFGLAGIDPRGRLIGTPSYMSPEIVNRETADGRSDLYSLTVLWYFCLARYNPFRTKVPRETMQNQVRLVPPPPSTFNGDVPPWMDAIIMRLLQKNPAKRFSHAARVMREINRFSSKKYPLETRETLVSYLPQEGELIGRKQEMEIAQRALSELTEGDARWKALLIQGALGSGKTRFVREFKYDAQLADVRVHMANAGSRDEYALWCDGFSRHLSAGEGSQVFILEDVEALVIDEAASQNLLALVSKARRPVRGAKVMLLISTTESEGEQFMSSLSSLIPESVHLKNFTPQELTSYLASLTGLEEPPAPLVDGIFKRTDGNPLFVTEVLKALIIGGGLFDEGGRWRATVFEDVGVDFTKVEIPSTVEGLLLDRVGRLEAGERTLLEALAVASRPSSGDELGAYAEIADPFPSLRALVQLELVDRTEEHRFVFRNELLGSTLYASLPLIERRRYHDRVARLLETGGASFETVAHHRCYGTDEAKALEACMALGELYLKRGLGKNAATYLACAEEFVPLGDVERRVDVLLKHGEALLIGKDYVGAETLFGQVEKLLPKLPEAERTERLKVDTLIRLGGTYMKLMSLGRARAAFTQAKVHLHTKLTDRVKEMCSENFLGSVLTSEGRYREARELFERTRAAWRKLDAEDRALVTNNDLGMVLLALQETESARSIFEEDLSFAKVLGDDLLIGRSLYNVAQLATAQGKYDEAVESYKQCAEVCKRSENTELLLRAYNGLGNIFHLKGQLDESISYYERGLALHERAGDARGGAAISVNIGIIENARQQYDAALDALIPAIDLIKGLRDKTAADWAALSRGLLELGDVYKNLDELDAAVGSLEQAYDIAVSHESAARQRLWILLTMAEVAKRKGDHARFESLISQMKPIAATDDERKRIVEMESPLPQEKGMASAEQPSREDAEAQELIDALSDWARLAKENARLMEEISKKLQFLREGLVAPPPRAAKRAAIDELNVYDPSKTWRDYERIIIAKAYQANGYHVATTAAALGIAVATLYNKVREWNLRKRENPVYQDPFIYDEKKTLDAYIPLVFKAALEHADGRPSRAIANLGVSQGYFYKIMKVWRDSSSA